MSETVTGYIDHIIYRNEDNGYTVMVLKGVKDEDELTCVGTFASVTQGATVEVQGSYTNHPVYGKQLQITAFDGEDAGGLAGNGTLPGLRRDQGDRCGHGGADCAPFRGRYPADHGGGTGTSFGGKRDQRKKAREIAQQVTAKADMRRAMIFCRNMGFP